MWINVICYNIPHTLSLRPFKFFSQQLHSLFSAAKLFHQVVLIHHVFITCSSRGSLCSSPSALVIIMKVLNFSDVHACSISMILIVIALLIIYYFLMMLICRWTSVKSRSYSNSKLLKERQKPAMSCSMENWFVTFILLLFCLFI